MAIAIFVVGSNAHVPLSKRRIPRFYADWCVGTG
jgi:hypothetical protein